MSKTDTENKIKELLEQYIEENNIVNISISLDKKHFPHDKIKILKVNIVDLEELKIK